MKNTIKTLAILSALAVSAFAQAANPYFDCWMENAGHVAKSEVDRLGIKTHGTAWICGCYEIQETSGEDWLDGEVLTRINKIWDLPEHLVLPCKSASCSDTSDAYSKSLDVCVDYLNRSSFSLADFADSGKVFGAVARNFKDDGSFTDFGTYFEERKERLSEIPCFFQFHERPGAPRSSDWNRRGVFSISGLPRNFAPEAIALFRDYSDVRCKDGNVWTGFLTNGYVENVMNVDGDGKFHGRETAYGNDPRYPMRQDKGFGKVLWTAEYRHGVKTGPAKFYRSSALDNIDAKAPKGTKLNDYYFLHLEVPYRGGSISGVVNMYSHKGFLMAEIPYRNNVIDGRVNVFYPFVKKADKKAEKKADKKKKKAVEEEVPAVEKKKVSITYKNGKLHGPNDLGYSFSNYRNGLLDGKLIVFNVEEECYEWIPVNGQEGLPGAKSNKICRVEKLDKQKWGTFKNGELQGFIECANGLRGNENIDCEDAY